MTKAEFVEHVAQRASLSRKQASDAVDAMIATIEEALRRGSEVNFTGFGKFHVASRGARQGVHPQTKQPIEIAATTVPRFTAGSGLKKAVRG